MNKNSSGEPTSPPPVVIETQIVSFTARDGATIAMALYLPEGAGPFPTLFSAAPYRFDNNRLPATPQFMYRENGPIAFYLSEGYAFVHMDIRGNGRSEGDFEFLSKEEQGDLVDAIGWITSQPWSNGKVGGIGQSYFCISQWFMGVQNPPGLACIGAHDGLNDPYRQGVYNGGSLIDFFPMNWWHQNRYINARPANDGPPRDQPVDINYLVHSHSTYDDFWRERSAWERLPDMNVPVLASGVWVKLHARGVVEGFKRAAGPKKLKMYATENAPAALREYADPAFHKDELLPFYDHYLKGKTTSYSEKPTVELQVRGSDKTLIAETWPPSNVDYRSWYLNSGPSGSVTSLNDGGLSGDLPLEGATTSYTYPQPGWVSGTVGFGPRGPASGFDPARRVLTFTSEPLDDELLIAGPIRLELYAASSQPDTEFFVKVHEQLPQSADERGSGVNPQAQQVSKGWLRASHRALDPVHSTETEPYHTHAAPEPLTPGEVYRFDISIEPMAYLFKAGSRIRVQIVNGDSPITEHLHTHLYAPEKIGEDTIHHGHKHPSRLVLPVIAD